MNLQPLPALSDETQARPAGVVLSDGTPLAELVDRDRRTVALRVCDDEEIFQLELERIFARAWICVGHESEVPAPGDFVGRTLGADPVIVVRDRQGTVQVLLNVCAHRGMQVCRADAGTARYFKCPYHGWTYDADGSLAAVPAEAQLYNGELDRQRHGLLAARTAQVGGWTFATWDEGAPPLEDQLGGQRAVLEAIFERTEAGVEVVGPPQRWVIPCNWKLAAEQFAGDAYHQNMTHRSMADIDLGPTGAAYLGAEDWSVFARPAEDYQDVAGLDGSLLPPGLNRELFEESKRRLSPAARRLFEEIPLGPGGFGIFPNFAGLSMWLPRLDGKLGTVLTARTWNPRGPRLMEVISWTFVERGAPPEMKDLIRQTTTQNFGTAGVYEQDDAEAWQGIQQAIRGVMGKGRTMDYSSTLRGRQIRDAGLGWRFSDDAQWRFWVRWLDRLTSGDR